MTLSRRRSSWNCVIVTDNHTAGTLPHRRGRDPIVASCSYENKHCASGRRVNLRALGAPRSDARALFYWTCGGRDHRDLSPLTCENRVLALSVSAFTIAHPGMPLSASAGLGGLEGRRGPVSTYWRRASMRGP